MTTKPLEEIYLEWLYEQVRGETGRRSAKTYWELLRLLLNKEFVWTVANDDNRVTDGLDVRLEFLQELESHGVDVAEAMTAGASVLEILVGLSRRLAFAGGGTPQGWAWLLVENLELARMHDPLTRRKEERIEEVLERLIWRTYSADGQGGFFPLAYPEQDQTKVELWYQMSAFLEEFPQL